MFDSPLKRIRAVYCHWNDFWFAEAMPESLGILRILTGGMLVYTHFVWGLKFQDFLGNDGFNGVELLKQFQSGSVPSAFFSFWWIVPEQYSWTVHLCALGILACFTLGLFTRLTSLLSLLITISYAHRTMLANYGLDQINTVLIFYLSLSRCGDAYSLDRLRMRYRSALRQLRNGENPVILPAVLHWSNNLAIRLLQFHYCVIYFMAGISKLQGESWWAGEAVWRAAANYEYQSADLTWLAHVPWLINLLTHGTILWEISFCFLVWNPNLRPLILLCGVAMHLGIGGFLGMWTFGSAMLFGYLAFVPPSVIQRIFRPLFRCVASQPVSILVRRDSSSECRRAARLLAFDFFHRVEVRVLSNSSDPIMGFEEISPSGKGVSHPDVAPLVVICSQQSSLRHARMLDYLCSRGFNCLLSRNVADARELTAFHQGQACLLWIDHPHASLFELSGNFETDWNHEKVPMILMVCLTDEEITEASKKLPRNIRLLSEEATYRQLRELIELFLLDRKFDSINTRELHHTGVLSMPIMDSGNSELTQGSGRLPRRG